MEQLQQHKALIISGAVVLVILGLTIWYMATHPAPHVQAPETATSTPAATQNTAEALHIKDSGKYYDIDTAYPSSTPLRDTAGPAADTAAVQAMKVFEENTISAFKENSSVDKPSADDVAHMQALGGDVKYAMTIEYKYYESPKTISYVYSIYQDTLGAHPNTYYRTFTFDRVSGEGLEISDLFTPSAKYLDALSTRTRADLPGIMAKMAQITPAEVDKDYINTGTLPEADAFQNFAIDGKMLLMIFPPYQVGPYVYGTIEDPIPLSAFTSILNPKYRM